MDEPILSAETDAAVDEPTQADIDKILAERRNIRPEDAARVTKLEWPRTRCFVRFNADGVVDGDLEIYTRDWNDRIFPTDLVDVTNHPRWKGLGSMMGFVRDPNTREPVEPSKVG